MRGYGSSRPVFLRIFLMVILSREEAAKGSRLHSGRPARLFSFRVKYRTDLPQLLRLCKVDGDAVLDPAVIPLTVYGKRASGALRIYSGRRLFALRNAVLARVISCRDFSKTDR